MELEPKTFRCADWQQFKTPCSGTAWKPPGRKLTGRSNSGLIGQVSPGE